MDCATFLNRIREKAGGSAGMILVHEGIVRATSRNGTPVAGIDVAVDHDRLRAIVEEARTRPGIVAVEVEVREGRFAVGEDIMLLGVAGDVRENVIQVLSETLDRIKTEATRKQEHFYG
ncbi:MAG: molybdenum cofactor biosynthesis protein MoaE [Deltaproteobacteria bacterium]